MRRISAVSILVLFATAALAVEPALPKAERPAAGMRHVILHSNGTLTPEDRTELAAKGVHVQRAITSGRYLARVVDGEAIDDARVARIEMMDAEKKLSRTARREASSGKTWANVNVFFHQDVTVDEARTALLAAGAALDDPFVLDFAPSQRLSVKIAPSQLTALASDDRVRGVTGPIKFDVVSDNARSAALSHVTEVHQAPYGLSGAGVTVSLFELGPAQSDHVEFGGRFTVQTSVTCASGACNNERNHATHVAGTISASGINTEAKGMAPQVRLYEFCVRAGMNTCRNDWLRDKNNELTKIGSLADNNSWGFRLGWEQEDYWVWNDGDDFFGAYELELVSPIDEISLDRNVLFVHSAGNEGSTPFLGDWGQHRHVDEDLVTIPGKLWCYSRDGSGTDCPTTLCTGDPVPCEKTPHHNVAPYDTLGFTAAGKNSIAVGAVQSATTGVEIVSFSSRGPAKDGRVKPDVVARGFGVLSTVPTNAYGPNQGTSMAAPVVTGIAALLVEQWRKTFATDPSPVQLKALIVAGADDLGRPGPDFTYGFGLVNAKNSVDFIREDAGARIRTISVGHGATQEIPIVLSAPQDLRVVLQWGDPAIPLVPGVFIADKALINDLDVKVIGPGGTEHLPYVLDKVDFEKNAVPGVNTVDNSEVVEIKNAAAGTYRIVVAGRDVPEGPQDAVVISTARTARPCVDLTESRNNSANDAYGDLTTGQTITAALCGSGDEDWFRWTAMPGAVSVTVTAGDTALSVALQGGVNTSVDVPANTTRTITANITGSAPVATQMVIRASGNLGAEPFYSFTPTFTQQSGTRRRSARH